MIKSQKKIFYSVSLLLGIFLNFSFYHSINPSLLAIEITAENHVPVNNVNFDCDLLEEEQIDFTMEATALINENIQHKIFSKINILSNLSVTVWQPPKV